MPATTYHPRKLFLFTALSLADLGMTVYLLHQGQGRIYESNPVANAWLAAFGWIGLAMFKAVTVLMVAGIAVFVSRSRPRTGGGILKFGCLATGGVVLYSCLLSGSSAAPESEFQGTPVVVVKRDNLRLARQLEKRFPDRPIPVLATSTRFGMNPEMGMVIPVGDKGISPAEPIQASENCCPDAAGYFQEPGQ